MRDPGNEVVRDAEKFIDISECAQTLLNMLTLLYLRKVQCICGEFLADMPNDLPYTFCAVIGTFSLNKHLASTWPACIYRVRKREAILGLTAL